MSFYRFKASADGFLIHKFLSIDFLSLYLVYLSSLKAFYFPPKEFCAARSFPLAFWIFWAAHPSKASCFLAFCQNYRVLCLSLFMDFWEGFVGSKLSSQDVLSSRLLLKANCAVEWSSWIMITLLSILVGLYAIFEYRNQFLPPLQRDSPISSFSPCLVASNFAILLMVFQFLHSCKASDR